MKRKIRISNILSGEIESRGTKIIIPFSTSHSEFDPDWDNIPKYANLIFTIDRSGDYVFSGIEAQCHCESCYNRRKQNEVEKSKTK